MSTITFNYADKRMWIFLVVFIINACLFAFGVITWTSTKSLHLPLPLVLPILGTILPVINLGGSIHALSMPTSKVVARPLRSGFPTILLLIADTALLALSASKSRNSVCEFHDKWQKMFQSHDGKAIEGIQNALRCCGFKGPLDMPFPFPRGDTKLNACTKATGRTVGCADAWENKEGTTAMTLAIIGGVLLLGKLFSLWIIQRGADLAQKKREAEAEAGEEARFEEVEESDGEGDVEGARGGRNGSPQPNETTPLMLEGSSPWIGESSVNGAGRGERERERDRAGH